MRDIQSYHVEWFVTHDARTDVTVRIGDGRLLSVEPGRTTDAIDLGPVALIEGLVNVHTHLEFSRLIEPISTTGRFTDWIRDVVKYRREHSEIMGEAICSGITESLQSGTTLIGDIATVGWSIRDYSNSEFRGVVFQELLGLFPDRIAQQKELARTITRQDDRELMRGISPHAPYSTHWDLVCEAVEVARQTGCPLAMHLAETESELELLATGSGEFRELLTDFGLWNNDLFRVRRRPMDYLEVIAEAPRSLIVHGNYLDEDEIGFLATRPHMKLVYCPRTHAAFGHSEHPWRRLLQLGGRVALGTDSRASNPDLSLFAELQFLAARHPDVSHVELLQLGSSEGRRALGFHELNRANFTLVRLSGSSKRHPARDLFAPTNRVCGTMLDGKWMWRDFHLKEKSDR